MNLTVGQELWYVPYEQRRERPQPLFVTKVGRKWAEVGFTVGKPDDRNYGPHPWGRVDIATLRADGGQYRSPGRCWLSRQAWEDEENRHATWRALCSRFVQLKAPPGLSQQRMKEIAAEVDAAAHSSGN